VNPDAQHNKNQDMKKGVKGQMQKSVFRAAIETRAAFFDSDQK
jgi:hypothetical protein